MASRVGSNHRVPVRFADPLVVEEPLHPSHLIALAGLHLGRATSRRGRSRAWIQRCRRSRRLVRGRSRRTGCARRSRRCPGPSRGPAGAGTDRERRRSRDGAAARDRRPGHRARRDVGVVDHRPHRATLGLGRDDLVDLGTHASLDDGEDLVDRRTGALESRPQCRLSAVRSGARIGRCGLPVR